MASNKHYLGELITQRREKNPGGDLPIRGVSKEGLQPPKQIDADTSIYNLYYRNDFVYNPARMELGSIAFNDEYDQAICSSLYEVFYVHRTDLVIPEYLALFVKHPEFARYCNYIGNGSAREYCRFENISGIPIQLPPVSEQRKIVHDYQVLTDRIELLRKMNDKLREIATTEFSNKIRNVRVSDEELVTSNLGTYPASWKVVSLGDVLSTIIDHRGVTPLKLGSDWSKDGIIALSAKSVKNHELVNLDIANRVDDELYERWMPEKLRAHDILMTSEAPLGEFYYIADFCEYCLSQRLFAMRANTDVIEPSVLYFQLTDAIGVHEIDVRKTGTTVFGIRQSELVKVPIVLPSKVVQKEFAKLCDPILLEIERNATQCRTLESLRDMILTGFQTDLPKGA